MKTLVATVEAAPALSKNSDGTIPIQNLRIAVQATNQFGLDFIKHMKVVTFNAVAKATAALNLKEGDSVFLDDCRVENRTYVDEKTGKTIPSEDLIANVVVKINKKQYADIAAKLAVTAATAATTETDDMTI